jgi:2'-5' RNA ligase
MKPGIVIVSPIGGDIGDRIREMQSRYDPRMAAELPPHITITGSSGMGPISEGTSEEQLLGALAPVAAATQPFAVTPGKPMRFMQSTVVVLPLDPHGPIRQLHERIKSSGLTYERPRFAFTPHITLSFYPELQPARLSRLLSERFEESIPVDQIQVYRTVTLTRTQLLLTIPLGGAEGASSAAPPLRTG